MVWVVSFDESEDGSDPTLRVFADGSLARIIAAAMCSDSVFYPQVIDDLAKAYGSVTLNYYDPDEEQHLRLVVHETPLLKETV